MNHLPYDAFNGSLVEQDLIHVVGNEEPPCGAIKKMAIGDIRPQEVHATKVEAPQVAAVPNSANNSDAEVQHTPAVNQQGGGATPKGDSAVPPT